MLRLRCRTRPPVTAPLNENGQGLRIEGPRLSAAAPKRSGQFIQPWMLMKRAQNRSCQANEFRPLVSAMMVLFSIWLVGENGSFHTLV